MSIFTDRLKECRKKMNKTQNEVAIDLGITEGGYQNYELCKYEPKMGTLIKFADYYDVSLDYLTGRSDNPNINNNAITH